MKNPLATHGSTSNSFIQKHSPLITGILRGFDRLRIRGTLRQLYCPTVMEAYLQVKKVLLKDFKGFAVALTDRVKSTALAMTDKAGRPYLYLASSQTRKETLARSRFDPKNYWNSPLCFDRKGENNNNGLIERTKS